METGERLSADEGLFLLEKGELLWLGRLAGIMRNRLHPTFIATYTTTCNVNYSNICICGCKFCAFYRSETHPQAYLFSIEEILSRIGKALAQGGIQILLQGGLHPRLGMDYFEDLFAAIKQRYQIHIHALSPPEIIHLSKLSKLSVREVLQRLKAAGLDSLPGGGAEILSPRVRTLLSPKKCSVSEWLQVMETTHKLGMCSSATMMFGHLETKQERVEHLVRIRELQDKTQGFTAFIPWTYQAGNNVLGKDLLTYGESSGLDYLRTLAVSRLLLDNLPNIQASLLTQGPKIAQLALMFGANDLGDLLLEEHVLRAAGVRQQLPLLQLQDLISEMGYQPRLRNTLHQLVENRVVVASQGQGCLENNLLKKKGGKKDEKINRLINTRVNNMYFKLFFTG